VPKPPQLPQAAWINKPKHEESQESELNLIETVSHFH